MKYYMIDPPDKSMDTGDMLTIKYAYERIDEPEKIESPKFSLTHPYKTIDQVESALKHDPSNPHEALSKMSNGLRKDPEAMIKLVSQTAQAYSYVHPSINDNNLKEKMVHENPNVYCSLSQEDKNDPSIIQSYRIGMLNNMREMHMYGNITAMQFKNQFDKDMDVHKVLSPDTYESAYSKMVADGVYMRNGSTLNDNFAWVATCRLLNKEDAKIFDEIDKKVWEQNREKVAELARKDRREIDVNNALTAIETITPEYIPLIEEKQIDYWRDRSHELMLIQDKMDAGRRLSGEEERMIEEASRHISLDFHKNQEQKLELEQTPSLDEFEDRELANNLLKIENIRCELKKQQDKDDVKIEKEREELLAYLVQDSKTRVFSAAATGDIDPAMASLIVGYLDSMPVSATPGKAYSVLAHTEAQENDIDNIDRDLAYSERTEEERENGEEELEYDADEDYEMNYAGNPFVSYADPNGMTQKYTY